MLLSAVSVLVVVQSSSEIPEGLMNNPVQFSIHDSACSQDPEDCSLVTCIVKVQKIITLLFVA